MTHESQRRLAAGGNGNGTVPVHQRPSLIAKIPLYGSPRPEPDHDVALLRQALWDVYRTLGFDCDGDETPQAVVGLIGLVTDAARQHRLEWDRLLDAPRPPKE